MSKPTISVVIPVFNRLHLLREALDSVAAQTMTDLEVVVVDDGSTDPSVGAIADHPVRPRLVRQSRQGPAAARNNGVAQSSADIVAFLDSDDLWSPTKLEVFLGAMQASPRVSVFYGPMLPVDGRGHPVAGRTKPRYEGRITDQLFQSCFVDVPTVVCRREVFRAVGGFDESLPVCEDYDLWLRLSLTEPFGYIDESLAKRRLHEDRLSKVDMARNLAVRAFVLDRFYHAHRDQHRFDESSAASRLSRVHFMAARAAFRQGEYEKTIEFCRKSRAYGRAPFRATLLGLAAAAMSRMSRGGRPNAMTPKRRATSPPAGEINEGVEA